MSVHFHTCTSCGVKTLCQEATPLQRVLGVGHPPDCPCVDCEDWLWCTGSDGEGNCPACAVKAFDEIGRKR
jgi:hypothetical protein